MKPSMKNKAKSGVFPETSTEETGRLQPENIPLATLKTGETGVISHLAGDEEFRCKMLALGILPGRQVTIIKGGKHQPYILWLGDSQIIMDWGALEKVLIRPIIDFEQNRRRRRWGWRNV